LSRSTTFSREFDQAKVCKNALNCTTSTLEIIGQIINPAFEEKGLPQITVRIGLDFGEALVVPYGKIFEKAHLDIIGSSISMAAKIASIAQPNEVLLGESIYDITFSSAQNNRNNISYNNQQFTR
jgi:adenylate cyclase